MGRIDDKINEIETFLQELKLFLPSNLGVYKHNFEKKAACERYFEKIVEALVDLAFLVVKEKNINVPEDEKEVFVMQKISRGVKPHLLRRNFCILKMRSLETISFQTTHFSAW